MEEIFLKISKNRCFGNKDLKDIDMLVLSQIEEFERNKKPCYITNEIMANNFNCNVSTINRSIQKLVELNYIQTKKEYKNIGGKIISTRYIYINKEKWSMQNSNSQQENVSMQNELLKDNIKENIKDNSIVNNNDNEKDNYINGIRIPKMEEEIFILKKEKEDKETRLKKLLANYLVDEDEGEE